MSNDLRNYKSIGDIGSGEKEMWIGAFVGGEFGAGIQFTIGNSYCCLAENQIKDLIKVLKKRVNRTKGFCATDPNNKEIIWPEKQDNT